MGKSLTREEKKNSKFILRDANQREKERSRYSSNTSDKPAKPKPKVKYRSHNDWDDD